MWWPLGRALGSATADGPSGSFDRGSFSMRWSEKDGGRRSQITSNSPNLGVSIRSKPNTYEKRRKEEEEEGEVREHGGTNRFEWVLALEMVIAYLLVEGGEAFDVGRFPRDMVKPSAFRGRHKREGVGERRWSKEASGAKWSKG